jgi:hypothetical protein
VNPFRRIASSRVPNAAILYRGVSCLDGVSPIVVVATGIARASKNAKTGAMVQTWILRDDIAPHVAAGPSGLDSAICGSCPHRYRDSDGHRTCYVVPHQAPLAVWRARDRAPMASAALRAYLRTCRSVRLGSYGDPAAVPIDVWASVVDLGARRHTGYTHQWRDPRFAPLRSYVMASADSLTDASAAWAMGWRTFRVGASMDPVQGREVGCLNVVKGTTCEDCAMCNGTSHKGPNVAIAAHGSGSRHLLVLG